MVHAVEKAIIAANLGLTPSSEGQVIQLRIPELNEERRKELVKIAHKYAETARVAVRHVRRDGMDVLKKMEKDHKISQDDHERFDADVQKVDRSGDRRRQPDAGRQRKGNHDGIAMSAGECTADLFRPSPTTCRVMSPSSWMATGAGPPRAACRARRAIAAASRRCAGRCGPRANSASRI